MKSAENLVFILHHYFVGTRRFSSSNQFSTTLICVGADAVSRPLRFHRARRAHPRPDSGDEIDQVAKTVLQHVLDHPQIHIVLAVDEHVAKAHRLPEYFRQFGNNPAAMLQQIEQLAVCSRFTKPLVGHDVRGHIESCFQSVPKFWYQARLKVISADRRFD